MWTVSRGMWSGGDRKRDKQIIGSLPALNHQGRQGKKEYTETCGQLAEVCGQVEIDREINR